jgi:segregation and condensation protein B
MSPFGPTEEPPAVRIDGLGDDPVAQPGELLPPLELDDEALRRGITGVLFVADEPIAARVLAETLGIAEQRIDGVLSGVARSLDDLGLGIDLVEVAGGWRLMTAPAARPVLERWIIGARHGRLTQAALETLAVVAYRQPIARVTIGEIRGVNPDGALRSLVARGLVAEVGREDGPGQAVLFGTTAQFLERMGLRTLDELPSLPPFLPDGPAPDEPDATGLAALRKRLRDGSQRLGAGRGGTANGAQQLDAAGALDDEDDEDDASTMAPPAPRTRRADSAEIVDLSDRLEQAARSAMGRLRHVRASQARADAIADAETSFTDTDGGADDPEVPADGTVRGPGPAGQDETDG